MIDNFLGVTAIVLGITGVGLLSTIVAAPAIIGMEAVIIVMGLLWVAEIEQLNTKSRWNRNTWKDCDVTCFRT